MTWDSADYDCPECDGRLRTKVYRLMYTCRQCDEVVVEVPGERGVVA